MADDEPKTDPRGGIPHHPGRHTGDNTSLLDAIRNLTSVISERMQSLDAKMDAGFARQDANYQLLREQVKFYSESTLLLQRQVTDGTRTTQALVEQVAELQAAVRHLEQCVEELKRA